MAVINCPCCHKRISNRSKQCPKCEYPLDGSATERQQSRLRVNQIERKQRHMTWQFVALLLFVGGFAAAYIDPEQSPLRVQLGHLSTAAGFIGYIVLRLWGLIDKE